MNGEGTTNSLKHNRFDVLDTETKLHTAFRNLQKPEAEQKLALVYIPEYQDQYFSDGSGTRAKSIMGDLIRVKPIDTGT